MTGGMFGLPITGLTALLIIIAYISWRLGYDAGCNDTNKIWKAGGEATDNTKQLLLGFCEAENKARDHFKGFIFLHLSFAKIAGISMRRTSARLLVGRQEKAAQGQLPWGDDAEWGFNTERYESVGSA